MAGNAKPQLLGLKPSFGFGDRLGLAGPGHVAAAAKSGFAPIFAQQSIRELDRTERQAEEVMQAAVDAIGAAGYDQPWGADADHLKTRADVERMQRAGFTFFTIDPSAEVRNEADHLPEADLRAEVASQIEDRVYGLDDPLKLYGGKTVELEGESLTFDDESVLRAAVKYGRAIKLSEQIYGYIAEANQGTPYEVEVSVDETDSATTALEHLFFAQELQRREVEIVSLAPRFIGEMEKGIDYKGDLAAFEASLKTHVGIAKACGPYKLSLHSGSDKFSIYPIFGRVCGDLIHVKTAGTSYLEALRVLVRTDLTFFREVVDYCKTRFAEDRATYHISVTEDQVASFAVENPEQAEAQFLEDNGGRQLLHVTFGSVLTKGIATDGGTMKSKLMANLEANSDLHREVLEKHFGKHLSLLTAG